MTPVITPYQLMIAERCVRLIGVKRAKGHTMTEEALRLDWLGVDVIKLTGERPFVRSLRRMFNAQERAALERWEQVRQTLSFSSAGTLLSIKGEEDDIARQLFDISHWKAEVERVFGPQILTGVASGFSTALSRLDVTGTDFTSDRPEVVQVLREVIDKTKGINDTIAKQLTEELHEGLISGEPLDDLKKAITKTWKKARGREGTIAQTALTPAFESGQVIAYDEVGVNNKRWLSRRDGLVRQQGVWDHYEPDGQTVGTKEAFLVSGESLKYPGDTTGSLRNIINCRCSTQPVL